MKNIFLAALLLFATTSFSQNYTFYSPTANTATDYIYYAAAKTGISMRDKPNAAATVLEKIPYGAKVLTLTDTTKAISIITEGFNGWWWKVKYNNKVGYVVSSYLVPMVPPKAGVKNMKDYFAQISSAAGSPIILKKGNMAMEGDGATLKKQLYKNGMEYHQTIGYEYGSEVYIIPDISVEQAFLLLRILNQYPSLINEKDALPSKNSTIKKEFGDLKITVEKDIWYENVGVLKHLTISSNEGALTELEIFLIDNQVVICWSSGV